MRQRHREGRREAGRSRVPKVQIIATVALAGMSSAGCGERPRLDVPQRPADVAVAYYEGFIRCDVRYARRSLFLMASPPEDQSAWLDAVARACRQDVPDGPAKLTARVVQKTPSRWRVAVRASWAGGAGGGEELVVERVGNEWKVVGA